MDGTQAVGQDQAVRDMLARWARAVTAGDLEAIMAHYASDIVSYDAIAALQFVGADAYREHWRECLSACGAMRFEIHEPAVTVAGDLALLHYLARCGGTGADGVEHMGWMRATAGCRRADGDWLFFHEHYSAPFDPASGKALFDLQPPAARVS